MSSITSSSSTAGGRWGSVARSRDPGLHGRKPVFATPRALALSYVDPYVDYTGRVTGYAVVDLRDDWATTTGGCRSGTCGRSSGCCSTARTGRSAAPTTRHRRGCARDTRRSRTAASGTGSRSTTRAGIGGRRSRRIREFLRCPDSTLVEIEVARRLGDRFLARLASASSKRFDSASPRVLSAVTDCWKSASRRAASSARIRCASDSSGRSPRTGSSCRTTRRRFVSMTSVAWQQGQVVSNSDLSVNRWLPFSRRRLRLAGRFPPRLTSVTGFPSASVAVTSTLNTLCRPRSNCCPKPVWNWLSGASAPARRERRAPPLK